MTLRPTQAWIAAGVLLLASVALEPRSHGPAPGGPLAWFGPLSRLASAVQWVRFQRAELAGEEARALVLAESAIGLAPDATEGWEVLTNHLGFFLASRERTLDLERRRAYFRAALETAQRGAELAAAPERLDFLRGVLLLTKAELDPELSPEGAPGLLREAAAAFGSARARGLARAADLEAYARERAGT